MNNQQIDISIVTPAYKCAASIPELCQRLKTTLDKITQNWEIIIVNDSSPQNDWQEIKKLNSSDKRVKGINLSRNFGQHNAIFAGLQHSVGQWVVVMDCDLQDTPEEIEKLYNEAQKGYDIVLGRRAIRYDNFLKKLSSKIFYKILAYFSETQQDNTVGNFGIYHRKVIDSVLSIGDKIKFFPVMVQWVGFSKQKIDVAHAQRKYGKTSYNFKSLLKLAINTTLSFSDKPLRLTVKLGLLTTFLSIVFLIFNIYRYFAGKIVEPGWTSIILSIWFFSGLIIFLIGIVGLYIGKIFETSKNRPNFIIKEKIL